MSSESFGEQPQPAIIFEMPEGFLDGTDMDIAHRWIDGAQDDIRWRLLESPDKRARLNQLLDVTTGYRARLGSGDNELAAQLAARATEEVSQLQTGERVVVTGQADLLLGRLLLRAQAHEQEPENF